jgi:glycosyltransferase involved in cell wall biosynthesis
MERSVSCTILAYNEEETLEEAVAEVHGALSDLGRPFEILVVDDGSTDRTAEVGRELEERWPQVRLIRHGRNLGSGFAILTGIRNATKDVVCFHPADGQVDFREVASYIPLLDDDADLLIGSRSGRPGYTFLRQFASQTYIKLAQLLFDLRDYQDFNFIYLYRREIFDGMEIDSNGIFMCTEILVRAIDRGARVREITAECKPRKVGLTKVFRRAVIQKTFTDMVGFWWKRRKGEAR